MGVESTSDVQAAYGLLIDGESKGSTSNRTITSTNPATGEKLSEIAAGTESDVDTAVESSRQALQDWACVDPTTRGQLLSDLAEKMQENRERLARILTLDNGKTLSVAKAEIDMGIRYFEFYAGAVDKIRGDTVPLGKDSVDYTIRDPLGVTVQILPWNFPIDILGRSVAPALATGNTVIAKPAEEASLPPLEIGSLATEVGFPDGVFNVVTGSGSEVGSALANHTGVNGISFTGSETTGISVAKQAAENITPIHLELGGKNPNVIYPDADIDHAVSETILGRFTNAGQACTACSRAIVHENIRDEFVEKLGERVESIELGPGLKDPDMGPLISPSHIDKVTEYINIGREEAGEPVVGGNVSGSDGNFVEPTVFDNVTSDMRIAQEEIFGPVLSVLTFSDEDEAIEIANDVRYGLNAAIFTSEIGRAHRFAREVQAGRVGINEWFAGGEEAPFGGYKHSGYGREGGLEAIDSYTQVKNVCANIEL
jgi:aldehyde dehydrogenase (NAD+)